MKKLLFIILIGLLTINIKAQTDSTYYVYSEVLFIPDASTMSHIGGQITYKKAFMYLDGKEILNEKEENTFNSETEGINYLAKQGWVVVSKKKIIIDGINLNQWLMKRKILLIK